MIESPRALEHIRKLDIHRTPRTERYMELMQHGMERGYADLDPSGAVRRGEDIRGYTAWAGFAAFHWACPMSRYHRDDRLLRTVKARLLRMAEEQVDGELVLPEAGYKAGWREVLGNSWYLEPMIFALLWAGEEFTEDERARLMRLVRRATDLNCALPCDETNNRGVVRSAVLCLAGQFLNDARYVRIGREAFHRRPALVFNPDGQINEGTGPDINYSGTTYEYLYQYRLFSGDVAIDQHMVGGLRWFTWVMDDAGRVGLQGASTRLKGTGGGFHKVNDVIAALERYAAVEPQFDVMADRYSASLSHAGPHHSICPLIWAMLEHEPREVKFQPAYFSHAGLPNYRPRNGPIFGRSDEGYDACYGVFHKDHHGIAYLRGRPPYKGFQHWTWGREQPVIWPVASHGSSTLAWGVNTAAQGVSGNKFLDCHWEEGPPHLLVLRFADVWQHYLVTQSSVVLVISSNLTPCEDRWVISREDCGEPVVGERSVTYEGRRGRMLHTQGRPQALERPTHWELRFAQGGTHRAYAFSNESFEFLDVQPERDALTFRDDRGEYEFQFPCRFRAEEDSTPAGTGKYTLEKGVTNITTGMIGATRRK